MPIGRLRPLKRGFLSSEPDPIVWLRQGQLDLVKAWASSATEQRRGVVDPIGTGYRESVTDVIVPALGRHWLTGLYDPVLRLTTRERRFKSQLLDQLSPGPGQRILDLASGTGTFALAVANRAPGVSLVGVDADAAVLRIAGRKNTAGNGASVPFVRGLSYRLPFATGGFDQVVSSLFLHHLTTTDKIRTLSEIVRVLRPGGRFHLADWTRGTDPVMRALAVSIRLLDGAETTQANFAGELPALLAGTGLENVRERASFRTVYGTLALFSAERAG